MASVRELVAAVRQAQDSLGEALAATDAARERLSGIVEYLGATLDGSSNDGMLAVLAALHEATERLDDAHARMQAAVDAVAGYLDRLGAQPAGPLQPCLGALPPAAVPSPRSGPGEPGEGQRPVPAHVRRLAAELTIPAGAKVAGLICDQSGRPLHDPNHPLTNGRRGGIVEPLSTLSPGQPPPWQRLDAATRHVEGHAAALLRQPDAPTSAALVITREPCDWQPWGCRYVLADLIPRDSVLDVYVVKDGQPVWFARYHGSGRGVAR